MRKKEEIETVKIEQDIEQPKVEEPKKEESEAKKNFRRIIEAYEAKGSHKWESKKAGLLARLNAME